MERCDVIGDDALDTDEAKVLTSILAQRRSCRKFLPRPVSPDKINRALKIAQLTASWCNSQPWRIIVTHGEETERFRRGLYETATNDALQANRPEIRSSSDRRSDLPMPSQYSGVRKERRRVAGRQLYEAVGVMGDREASLEYTLENFRFFDAPHAAVFTSPAELGAYGVLDVGGYLANLMLVFQSLGVSSIPQAALAVYGDFIRSFFNIAEDQIIVCGMSFGYADSNDPANSFNTSRADISEAVAHYG